VQCGIL